MADNGQQLLNSLHARLAEYASLAAVAEPQFLLAYSGGLDSSVLLHALHQLVPTQIRAIHVHHGLQADADAWVLHCEQVCQQLNVPFSWQAVDAHPKSGEGPEAAARAARYAAFRQALKSDEILLTAHHQNDQAETVLLRLLRGSGARGLSAIRPWQSFAHAWLARPLLAISRDSLERYAREQGLSWIEDGSNQQLVYDRNFLRQQVLPLIQQRWPAADRGLARSAQLHAEFAEIALAQAQADMQQLVAGDGVLHCAALLTLSRARQKNLLYHWLEQHQLMPGEQHIERILDEVLGARHDANPQLILGHMQVRRYRQQLYLLALDDAPPPLAYEWDGVIPLQLVGQAAITLQDLQAQGLVVPADARLSVGFADHHAQLRLATQRHHKSLKKHFQEAGIPPWRRTQLPRIYINGQLAAVIGLGIAQEFYAERTD